MWPAAWRATKGPSGSCGKVPVTVAKWHGQCYCSLWYSCDICIDMDIYIYIIYIYIIYIHMIMISDIIDNIYLWLWCNYEMNFTRVWWNMNGISMVYSCNIEEHDGLMGFYGIVWDCIVCYLLCSWYHVIHKLYIDDIILMISLILYWWYWFCSYYINYRWLNILSQFVT